MKQAVMLIFSVALVAIFQKAYAQSSTVPKSFLDLKKEAGGPIHSFSIELAEGDDPVAVKSVTQLNCIRKMIAEYQTAVADLGGETSFHPAGARHINDISLNLYDLTGSTKQQSPSILDDNTIDEDRGPVYTAAVWAVLSTDPKTHTVSCKFPSAQEVENRLKAKPYDLIPSARNSTSNSSTGSHGSVQ